MAQLILQNSKLYIAGHDFSGDMNALSLDYGSDLQEDTAFGDDTHSRAGGLKTILAAHEGFVNLADDGIDETLFGLIGTADTPTMICPIAGAENERSYMFLANHSEYNPGGAVGEMFQFGVRAEATGDLIQSTVLHNASRTSTADGTGRNIGAVSASQFLYASIHVFAVSGTSPTLDVILESDAGDTWTGDESTRITFAEKSAISAEWATPVAGEITDAWWRIGWTIGGTDTPTFGFIVSMGIQ